MTTKPSTHDHDITKTEQLGVSRMELVKSQELIKQLKEIKENNEITYPRILERMEKNGKNYL